MNTLRIVFLLGLMNTGVAMGIEEPTYVIDSKKTNYEIRNYGPMVVAETVIDSDFEGAGNQAFRILAAYIFGENRTETKIADSAPSTQSSSEKIAMTAPVTQSKAGQSFIVQFTMPKKYTLKTLPSPTDSRVHLRQIEPRLMAVLSYSGSWSESRYQEKLAILRDDLKKDRLQTVGEPVFARFNSPFQLWFLRRNEIWQEIKRE
jgi:hypothetical protein